MKILKYSFIPLLLLMACNNRKDTSDAFGNFMAVEILVSAENAGKIIKKNILEGEKIKADQVAYQIDTIQSFLKKQELIARRKSVIAKQLNIQAQISVLNEQERALKNDLMRFRKLLPEGAVSQKQVDDLENNLLVIQKQIAQVKTNFLSINAEVDAIDASIKQVNDLLKRATIVSPATGTVLATYTEEGESVNQGKPLFKIANLDTMELKAYFSAQQLAEVKIGDEVWVLTDDGNGGIRKYKGQINWIASSAEFTPKIIQTREERVNLVYAVKIIVLNDGYIRINMPGEVRFIKE